MSADPRSGKIAVVADALLVERLPSLRDAGYGVMQLPPAGLSPATAHDWLAETAEQIAEFRRHGYEVVLVDDGSWGSALAIALERLGVAPLSRADPA